MKNLIGASIDHYQILAKIRETPTRVLYKAHSTRSQTYVALEVIKTAWLAPDKLLELINDQARKNAELDHPNVASVLETGLENGQIYIAYDFCPAHPLRPLFNRAHPWKDMARELVSISHAVAYAHDKGIIHGWLHPGSILLDARRNPILFDFGLERIITDYILDHAPGSWISRWGFEYRAPEQINGAAPDKQADIYALGIMIHEWLTGKVPQLGATPLGTLQRRRSNIKFTRRDSASIPAVVQNLIKKCISRKPKDRYQSMQEVYIILARGALDMSLTKKMVRRPLAIPARIFKLTPAHIRRVVLATALVVLAAAAFMNRSTISAAILPATATPTSTQPPSTPTQTVPPTNTPRPTQTAIPPTATPLQFPVFQEISISSAVNQTLSPGAVDNMVMLGVWGIGNIHRLAYSPDGIQVAVASSIGIFILNAQSLELERYIDTRSSITVLEFSQDGGMLATGDSHGLIQVWNARTWDELETRYSGHLQAIVDLAFSPDGTRLASADEGGIVIQWLVNSPGNPRTNHIVVTGGVNALAYSGDGNHIVTGGGDLLISIWHAGTLTLEQRKTFSGKIVDIAAIKGSADRFVIGGNDQRVALLELGSGADPETVGFLRYPLSGVAASADGRLIASGDIHGGIAVWDASDDRMREVFRLQNYIRGDPKALEGPGSPHSLAFSRDGSLIFSALHNGVVRSLNSTTGDTISHNLTLNAHVIKMAVSHDGRHLLTQQDNDTLTMWDVWSGTPRYQIQGEIMGTDPFSTDDQSFAISSAGPGPSVIGVYTTTSGEGIHNLGGQSRIGTIRFVNNNSQLIVVYDQFIELWSTSSGQKLETRPEFDGSGCQTIKDVNGQPVASITNYQYVITINSNKPGLCSFSPLNWKVAIDESAGMILFGGESVLAIADARTPGRENQNLRGVNRRNITSVAISPDGDLVAAAYDDHSIHIWDTSTRDELTNAMDGLFGHRDTITGLQFTPDGKLLISTSLDGTIRLWGVPY